VGFFGFGSTSIRSTVITSAAPTMNRRMYGRMDGYQYIYCLPPAGGRIRSQGNYYCLPPAGVLHSQNKVIKCAAYGVAQRGGGGMGSLI
jgi:hypothetical protein